MSKECSVFVVSVTGKRLMPTTPRKARLLVKQGRAHIFLKRPYTIQLNYKTGGAVQETTLGIDTGSQHIGVAVNSNDNIIYEAEIVLRNTMEKRKLIEARKAFRGLRRYRKVRYRKNKFRHHTKRVYVETPIRRKGHKTHWNKVTYSTETKRHEGWLPPSIEQKVNHHFDWIDRYVYVLPEGINLVIEVGRFDMARIQDPTIHGELYQRGPQYDYENVKAYVFDRDGYRCKCCGAKAGSKRKDGTTVKLIAHHVLLRAEGATDNPKYLVTVCDSCHSAKNHKPGGILYQWYEEGKTFSRGLRDATFMNILRRRMFAKYPDAVFTYGNITSADRQRLLLPKGHVNDAVAIASMTSDGVNVKVAPLVYRQVRKKKRSLHEANPRKGRTSPNREAKRNNKNAKYSKGFSLWDKVSFCGTTGWISGFCGEGNSAYVVNRDIRYIPIPGTDNIRPTLSRLSVLSNSKSWIIYKEHNNVIFT